LTLLIFLPFLRPSTVHWSNIAGFRLADSSAGTFSFFISWVFMLTWSVLGTEGAACYIGECRDSTRDAKVALSTSGLYGSFIYVAIPLLLVAVLGRSQVDPLTAFLAYTEAIFGSEGWVKWIIGIPLVVALLLSVLNAIMGCGRAIHLRNLSLEFKHFQTYRCCRGATALVFTKVTCWASCNRARIPRLWSG
jgi:amino acid transporter